MNRCVWEQTGGKDNLKNMTWMAFLSVYWQQVRQMPRALMIPPLRPAPPLPASLPGCSLYNRHLLPCQLDSHLASSHMARPLTLTLTHSAHAVTAPRRHYQRRSLAYFPLRPKPQQQNILPLTCRKESRPPELLVWRHLARSGWKQNKEPWAN